MGRHIWRRWGWWRWWRWATSQKSFSCWNKKRNKKETKWFKWPSLFNIDNLNNIQIKNRINNNKTLIKPEFYTESNITDKINKPHLEVNNINLKIKKKKQLKARKLCNKFKISRENKNKIPNRLTHKRKYKPDDIRKKIKARFHKSIKNIINGNLKKAGSKQYK